MKLKRLLCMALAITTAFGSALSVSASETSTSNAFTEESYIEATTTAAVPLFNQVTIPPGGSVSVIFSLPMSGSFYLADLYMDRLLPKNKDLTTYLYTFVNGGWELGVMQYSLPDSKRMLLNLFNTYGVGVKMLVVENTTNSPVTIDVSQPVAY